MTDVLKGVTRAWERLKAERLKPPPRYKEAVPDGYVTGRRDDEQ